VGAFMPCLVELALRAGGRQEAHDEDAETEKDAPRPGSGGEQRQGTAGYLRPERPDRRRGKPLDSLQGPQDPDVFFCMLCREMHFESVDELEGHVQKIHPSLAVFLISL
jgi:hypothetical protein